MNLEKFGVVKGMDCVEGVQKFGEWLETPESFAAQHARANAAIKSFGGNDEPDPDAARIIAKYMLAQVVNGQKPDQELARTRCQSLIAAAPEIQRVRIVQQTVKPVVSTYKPKTDIRKGKNNTKKAAALKICEANPKLSNNDLAKLIQKELKITFANAYYYSSRVYKR